MTTEDIEAAVELISTGNGILSSASKARASLETKVGNSERNRRIEISAVLFLRTMEQQGGTFVWQDGPRRGFKFSTVFEALAATLPEFDELGLIERGEFVKEYEPKLRSGFYAARKWLGKWYMDTVFSVPQHTESSIPTVITLDPEYVLECGKTAAQMQAERDFKLADGQIKASTRRLAASTKQKQAVRDKLEKIMAHAVAELEDMRPQRS